MRTQMEKNLKPFADKLWEAQESRVPISPLTDEIQDFQLEDAYAIQQINVARKLQLGEKLTGYKIGLTSLAAQKHFNVFEPDFGHLFYKMEVSDGGELDFCSLISPQIEGEIAFILKKELKGPNLNVSEVIRAVDYVLPCLEIIDSRISNWKIKALDTISDNASSSRYVLGSTPRLLSKIDLSLVGMALYQNGEVIETGAGAAVMNHPIQALVFLANTLGKKGISLKPGEVVLSGSLGGMIRIRSGDHYLCEMSELGRVSVRVGGIRE